MKLTWFDSNSWLIETEQKTILLDPWLVGSLVFGNMPWLFKGDKINPSPIPENIDLILLSQGLEDHAHVPTLKQLDRNIPVLGSPNAAQVCEKLGYTNINILNHDEYFILDEKVKIKAVKGSPIGPTLVENGYIIKDLESLQTLYYEPHGFHSSSLKNEPPIDIIITPLINLNLSLLGPVIKGKESALEVCKMLKPKYILPTAAGGEIEYQGLLLKILKEEGNINNFGDLLLENNLKVKVITPKSKEPVIINMS